MKYAWILSALLFFSVDVNGKVNNDKGIVVITGATKGLGLALVKQYAKNGWVIAGCGRDQNSIKQLQKEFGSKHLFEVVDVTSDAAVAEWSKMVSEKLGMPDILINNAGVINRSAPLWEISPEDFNSVLTTNVVGPYNCLRHFVPMMIKRGKGTIINMSSIWGREGGSEFGPYCASKFALEGLTKCLAEELPKGMIAVSLDPGAINTDMLRKAIGDGSAYPSADQWAERAFPYIMKISLKDNGKALTVP